MFEEYALCVAVSVSYICLFVVLTFYNYEVVFRTGILFVAVAGFWYPILYGFPYVIIVLRVFVGSNVATDQKLYIARRIEQADMDKADFLGSTSLNHWAVAIQDGGRYFYTHAVGAVVSGKGEKKPFRKMTDPDKYNLTHVGFVTRKQRERKTEELVATEPMVSGNTCQEYAVDIAFQLSSSRTYTFVKIMTLPRLRNIFFYIAIISSIVLKMFNHRYSRPLNPLFLTNLFAALELSRIGIHNQTQEVSRRYISSVIRAYIIYPTRGNIFALVLMCVSFAYLYQRIGIEDCIVLSCLLFVILLVRLR